MSRALFVILLFLLFPKPVYADLKSARVDYAYQSTAYKTALENYQVAKSSYQTYRTLVSQDEAVNRLRQAVQARDQVITSYYSLLLERLNTTEGITAEQRNTFKMIRDSEIAWLAQHQRQIDDASTLDDLNVIAAQFEGHYPQFDKETKQAIGLILLTRVSNLKTDTDRLVASFSAKLVEIQQDGQDTNFLNRGMLTVRNKSDLYQQKYTEAKLIFYPATESSAPIQLLAGRQKLAEASQYLHETLSYLLELIRNVTG